VARACRSEGWRGNARNAAWVWKGESEGIWAISWVLGAAVPGSHLLSEPCCRHGGKVRYATATTCRFLIGSATTVQR